MECLYLIYNNMLENNITMESTYVYCRTKKLFGVLFRNNHILSIKMSFKYTKNVFMKSKNFHTYIQKYQKTYLHRDNISLSRQPFSYYVTVFVID